MYLMTQQAAFGAIGEIALSLLLTYCYRFATAFVDVRNVPYFRSIDVDYIVYFADGTKHYVEVKTDSYTKTGNAFAEYKSSVEHDTLGWIYKTEARWIFYIFVSGSVYIMQRDKFVLWLNANKDHFKSKEVENQGYMSAGYLVPTSELIQLDCTKKCNLFDKLATHQVYMPEQTLTTTWAAEMQLWLRTVSAAEANLVLHANLPDDAKIYTGLGWCDAINKRKE